LLDYLLAASASIVSASAIILVVLLWRYRELMRQADTSSRLAKDVWDSVASRFSVVDARIIDLMAKTEVLSSRLGPIHVISQQPLAAVSPRTVSDGVQEGAKGKSSTVVMAGSTDTEVKVLGLLVKGSRTSAQIKDELGKSREHTARVMKGLFDRGLVVRNDRNKPYVYEITESGRTYVPS
jgi:hypothetical protein